MRNIAVFSVPISSKFISSVDVIASTPVVANSDNLVDNTLIPNHATIIFDNNEGINTSLWQNVVDVTPPQSSVSNITITDTMALLTVQATDNI